MKKQQKTASPSNNTPSVLFQEGKLWRETLMAVLKDTPGVIKKLEEFKKIKEQNPLQPFGGSDKPFVPGAPLSNLLPKARKAHLSQDVSIVYELSGKNPTIIKLYGVFTHAMLGTGQPANINVQKSMGKRLAVSESLLREYSRDITANQVGNKIIAALEKDPGNLPDPMWHSRRDLLKGVNWSNIDDPSEFKSIIISRILDGIEQKDPTPNKQYTPWLARMYANGNVKYEDLNRNNLIGLYDLAKKRRMLKPEHNDINRFKTYREFEDTVYHIYNGFQDLIQNSKEEGAKAEKIFENEELLIVRPDNEAAAIKYGRGTRWCTAATQGENYFKQYDEDGALYILIPKKPEHPQEKYQLHFQSAQLMNEKDEEVNLLWLMRERFKETQLNELFAKLDPEYKSTVEFVLQDKKNSTVLEKQIKILGRNYLNRYIKFWRTNDRGFYKLLIKKGYTKQNGSVDWGKVDNDRISFLEHNSDAKTWYKKSKKMLDDFSIENFIKYIYDRYYFLPFEHMPGNDFMESLGEFFYNSELGKLVPYGDSLSMFFEHNVYAEYDEENEIYKLYRTNDF